MSSVESIAEYATAQLLDQLKCLGVDTNPSCQSPPLKRMISRLFGSEAHCFIDIINSPITWIDIAVVTGHGTEPGSEKLYTRYGVNDPRLCTERRRFCLSLVPFGKSLWSSKINELHWHGKGSSKRIANHLNRDQDTLRAIISSFSPDPLMDIHSGSVWINRDPPFSYWLVCTRYPVQLLHPALEIGAFNIATWLWIQKIATNLLELSLTLEPDA